MPVFSPHDLRRRYISLLVAAGVPVTIITPVVGHRKASTSLDVDEGPARLARLRAAAIRVVANGATPVRPRRQGLEPDFACFTRKYGGTRMGWAVLGLNQ